MRSEVITCNNHIKRAGSRVGSRNLQASLVLWLYLFVFLSGLTTTAHASIEADFQAGVKAYLKGSYAAAFGLWQPLAEQGDAPTQFNLGVLYAQGLGVKKDQILAVKWYQRAAAKGYTPAQFNLGEAYFTGTGVTADVRKAIHWWRTAAKHQHVKSQYNLGYLYLFGNGVTKDREQAIFWFQQAAAQSDPYAIKMLNSLGIKPVSVSSSAKKVPVNKAGLSTVRASATEAAKPNADAGTLPKKKAKSPQKSVQQRVPTHVSAKQSVASQVGNQKSAAKGALAQGAKNAKWLQQQLAKYFTVQLLADRSRSKITAFYQHYRWDRPVAVFKTSKAGKTWYKLVYGIFENRTLAEQIVAAMPAALQNNHPWIRSLTSVQKEIASFQKTAAVPVGGSSVATTRKTPPPLRASQAPKASTNDSSTAVKPKKQPVVVNKKDQSTEKKPIKHTSVTASSAPKSLKSKNSRVAQLQNPIDANLPPLQRARRYFTQKNYQKAYQTWLPLAEAGVEEAQYNIGFLYETGWGVKANFATAAAWYQRAAQSGHAKAQFNLALLYLQGNGVETDTNLANYWLQSAADGGDRRAELYLNDARKKPAEPSSQ